MKNYLQIGEHLKTYFLILLMLLIFLTGCSVESNVDPTEKYEGEELRIGIIGNIPEIRETQVEFEKIDLEFLKEDYFDSKYDAIFITNENLSEASNAEYASIYKTSKIPFYFIGNEKSHVNFIKEDLSYEDEPDANDGMYVTGLFYIEDEYWGYGLYNNTESDANIKAIFSKVFEDILKIKNEVREVEWASQYNVIDQVKFHFLIKEYLDNNDLDNPDVSLLVRQYWCFDGTEGIEEWNQVYPLTNKIALDKSNEIKSALDFKNQLKEVYSNSSSLKLMENTIVSDTVLNQWNEEGYNPEFEYSKESPKGLTYDMLEESQNVPPNRLNR